MWHVVVWNEDGTGTLYASLYDWSEAQAYWHFLRREWGDRADGYYSEEAGPSIAAGFVWKAA